MALGKDSFIVHISKKRLWEKINDLLIDLGYRWDGASARGHWKMFGNQSCIDINHETKTMSFGSIRHYKKVGELIFSAKDFMSLYNKYRGFFGFIRMFFMRVKLQLS